MFWTTLVRGWNKVFLVLGIIASVIAGIALWGELEGIALLVMLGGIFVCFISVSVIMMISEISVSLHELNEKSRYNQSENNSTTHYTAEPVIHTKPKVNDSWVCKCGTRNPNTAKFCKSCGTSNADVVSTDTSVYGNIASSSFQSSQTRTWICPDCDMVNPMSSRTCKGCGRDK